MVAKSSGPGGVARLTLAWPRASQSAKATTNRLSVAAGRGLSRSVTTTVRSAGSGVPTSRIFSHCSVDVTMSSEASQSARM